MGAVSALMPVGLPVVLAGSLVRPRWRVGLAERLSLRLPGESDGLWCHAASLGEMRLAVALMDRLGVGGILTTNTVAGRDEADRSGRRAWFAPLDHPFTVRRFMGAARPRALFVLETELWPGWLSAVRRRSIPVALVNGRLSERALRRYRYAGSLMRETLRGFDLLLMRSEGDADRMAALGAPADRLRVVGDLKAGLPAVRSPETVRTRYGLPDGLPVWIAGSTDEPEEEAVLEIHQQLRDELPDALLVIAPRQKERFETVWKLVRQRFPEARRASAGPGPAPVILLDRMGELALHYVGANAAFVGGSFTDRGGQNILEPALVGCPVAYGPRVANWEVAAQRLEKAGGAERCRTPLELGNWVRSMLAEPQRAAEMGLEAAKAAPDPGVWERVLPPLQELLEVGRA